MLIPLAIINHFKPTRDLPEDKQLHELYPVGTERKRFHPAAGSALSHLAEFFPAGRSRAQAVSSPGTAGRSASVRSRRRSTGCSSGSGRGATGWRRFSRRCSTRSSRCARSVIRRITRSTSKGAEGFLPASSSMIRKTSASSRASRRSGTPRSMSSRSPSPACRRIIRRCKRAAQWLVDKEVRFRGDWTINNPHPEASGWAFEYNNVYYPDMDDTAMVLMALRLVRPTNRPNCAKFFERALNWQMSFQCNDGGWAAFDKDVTRHWLEDMPFADHNAMLDPTAATSPRGFWNCSATSASIPASRSCARRSAICARRRRTTARGMAAGA